MSTWLKRLLAALKFVIVMPVVLNVVVTSAFFAAIPCMATAQTGEDSVAVQAQIEAYQNAWNTHNPAALARFFTEDADMVMGNLPAAHGRQAIQKSWGDYFASQEPERTINIDVKSIRLIASDVALANVATTTGGRDVQGDGLKARKARGTWLLRQQEGDWLIEAMRGFPTEKDSVEMKRSIGTAQSLMPQIRAFVRAYEEALNVHDPAALSAFYTDDANIMVRNLPAINGRQAILDWWRIYFSESRAPGLDSEAWYESMRAILIIDEIRMLTADIAQINITVTAAARQPDAELLPVRYARATWVVVREAREWKIAALWVLPSEEDRIIRESDH